MIKNTGNNYKGIDLLKFSFLRRIVVHWSFPYIFQVLTLAVFIFLIILGWNLFPPAGFPDKLFAKLNLINLTIWGMWWPLMIWISVIIGRGWCAICPLELVSNISERVSRLFPWKQKKLGKALKSGSVILLLYLTIQLLVSGIHLHRIPAYTAWFLSTLLALAILSGIVFKDRAFCRAFCPVGLLLNAYGRGGILALRPLSRDTCASCTTFGCRRNDNRQKADRRSCPSLLNPAQLNSNADCLLCGQCIKSCEPENTTFLLRKPFATSNYYENQASWPLTLFIMMVSGFVSYELCSEWHAAKTIFLWMPDFITEFLALGHWSGWIKGLWTLLIYPILLWAVFAAVGIFQKPNRFGGSIWQRMALPMAVLISSGHMFKALAKFASWGNFLPMALSDPAGKVTTALFAQNLMQIPMPLLSKTVVAGCGIILLFAGLYFARKVSERIVPGFSRLEQLPLFIIFILFTFIICGSGGFFKGLF